MEDDLMKKEEERLAKALNKKKGVASSSEVAKKIQEEQRKVKEEAEKKLKLEEEKKKIEEERRKREEELRRKNAEAIFQNKLQQEKTEEKLSQLQMDSTTDTSESNLTPSLEKFGLDDDKQKQEEERLFAAINKKSMGFSISKPTITRVNTLSAREEPNSKQEEIRKKKEEETRLVEKQRKKAEEERKKLEQEQRRTVEEEKKKKEELINSLKSRPGKSIIFEYGANYDFEATCFIAGTFSNWESVPMEREDSHVFKIKLNVPPGVHIYKFLVDGKWMHDLKKPTGMDENGTLCNRLEVE